MGGSAGHVSAAAFGADGSVYGDGGGDYLSVLGGSLFIGVGYMLLFMGTHGRGGAFRGYMLRRLERNHLV